MSETKTIQDLTGQLDRFIQNLPFKAGRLSNKEWERKPNPEKWSKKEILGHLIDSALNNLKRFTEIQYQLGTYQVVTYQQDRLVKVNQYQKQHLSHLLRMWTTLNQQISKVWENTDPQLLQTPVLLPDLKTKHDLEWLMADYVRHLDHHVRQIFDHVQDWSAEWPYRVTVAQAYHELEKASPAKFVKVLEHGSMEVEIYVPEGEDLQQPHTRDELYFVISGHGTFVNGNVRHPFQPGDALFVPAGVEHRFEDFSNDFRTWVVFYGPEGGEAD